MDAAKVNLVICQGGRFEVMFTLLDETGHPISMTDKFIEIGLRQGLMTTQEVGIYDMSQGYAWNLLPTVRIDGSVAGTFYWMFPAEHTKKFDWFTDAYYDILVSEFTADYPVVFQNGTKAIPNDGTDGTNMTDALGEPTQSVGTGLDDFSYNGPWSGTGAYAYECRIFSVGAQDTFEWRMNDGSGWSAWDDNGASGYNCQPAGVTPAGSLGIKFIFAAITGHTDNDEWAFYVWDGVGYAINTLDATYGTGTIYPSTSNANQRVYAKAVKPFRNYDEWLPSHGPIYREEIYTPGSSYYNDLVVSGHKTAHFAQGFWNDVQWHVRIDGVGSPNTFKWRANAGGSWYGWGVQDLWFEAGTVESQYWNASGISITAGTPIHLAGGVFVDFTYNTGHQLGDSWFFRTSSPIISIILSSNNNNGLYRLAQILNNGDGLMLKTSITGIAGTGTSSSYDATVQLKKVWVDQQENFKPVRGDVKVVPLLAHNEKYTGNRYPTFIGY